MAAQLCHCGERIFEVPDRKWMEWEARLAAARAICDDITSRRGCVFSEEDIQQIAVDPFLPFNHPALDEDLAAFLRGL